MITRKTNLRLIIGVAAIFLAVLIAVGDSIQHIHFSNFSFFKDASSPQDSESSETSQEEPEDDTPTEADETLQVLRGDTLSSVLQRADIDLTQANEAIAEINKGSA